MREELWARDEVPAAERRRAAALARDGNPYGRPRALRSAWAAGLRVAPAAAGADTVLYLPGCAAALAVPDEARAALQLMQAAGCAVRLLGDADGCCGAPWHELGRGEEAAAWRRALAGRCASDGDIVSSGLECARSWQRDPVPASSRIHTFVEWLAARLTEGRPRLRSRGTPPPRVRVLDSCQSRGGPIAQCLRELLGALGVAVLSEATAPAHVICCGAAGGLPATQPASARRMAEVRLETTDPVSVAVSADPRCVAHLRQVADATEIYGPAEYLCRYFEADAS